MSDSDSPVAKLAGVTLPGHHRPAGDDLLSENVSVLRRSGGSWSKVKPRAGMDIHDGDVIHLKGDPFRALGARAFVVDGSVLGGGEAHPSHLHLIPHEVVHVRQQGPALRQVNEADAEALERGAVEVEEMVLHRPAGR